MKVTLKNLLLVSLHFPRLGNQDAEFALFRVVKLKWFISVRAIGLFRFTVRDDKSVKIK